MIYFKKNLAFLRLKKGMTIAKISKEIGFSASQWNNYELGISFPKFLDFIKISKYFDVSESDLIHKDLEVDKTTEIQLEKDVILLQNKVIELQDEKINILEQEISKLKIDNNR